MKDLRCYVCGKPIEARIVLVSMSKNVDRVFVLHDGTCLERAQEDAVVAVVVERVLT